MKRFLPIQLILIVIITILVLRCTTMKAAMESTISFREVNEKTLIPEGIAVHPVTGKVFLSSLHQNKIVTVDNNGRVTDVITKGQQGFMWGLGMKFSKDGRILWACTADGNGKTALFA